MMNAQELLDRAGILLETAHHIPLEKANAVQLHNALSAAAMESLAPVWAAKEQERAAARQACYISAEFLVGRLVYNNLFCMGLLKDVKALLAARGIDIAVLEDIEDDAFGNGGLGRLAACFLDSAATCGIPLTGYGLRYRYGLFKQTFVDCRQVELPDDWSRFGDPWSIRRDEDTVTVHLKSGDVLAVPYDMPVVGYGARNIGTLRLWQCESPAEIDFATFNSQDYAKAASAKNKAEDITKFLYPNDTKFAGKQLRVKQQYVLVSATIQDLLRAYRSRHGSDYSFFAAEYAVQLNDTHPVMAVPELIRLLQADGVSFEDAFLIARDTFAFTNHTVMQEALEKWDLRLLRSVCPEIVEIMKLIDGRFRSEMAEKGLEVLPGRCVIEGKRVHMAQLAVYATRATNGVAEIHSQILKDDVFADWYAVYPERFRNKTNGITQRRWLGLCNPDLCALIDEKIGPGAMTDLYHLRELEKHTDDETCLRFAQIKHMNKVRLADEIRRLEGIDISPDMVFDIQIKRLHEYKRQFMNALSILAIRKLLKEGKLPGFRPTAFIFGAKAAPGYDRAKTVIRLINMIADLVNNDPEINGQIRVCFVRNYNCSWAEVLIPAADISEQISPAGTEASGTGNMKLMLNGAVTLGTYDGANIEIVEEAGEENNYIFGARVDELNAIRAVYDPVEIYEHDPLIHDIMDMLVDGTFPDEDGGLKEMYDAILAGASWHRPDHYFVLKDFPAYLEAKLRAIADTEDTIAFARKGLLNTAGAGKFSSDRTVREYAEDIWNV
ncbi:MAG: glycogen/starch/alpha-glucan phosphorylase [Clostridia bacterium]|nr:glycogen/starch/alpha-glucan phosphorylase [Clostridia bacterium]